MTTPASLPHLAYPVRLGFGGALAAVEQDTLEEISQNVLVVLLTPRGTRLEIPDFGVDEILFETRIDHGTIIQEVGEWEPRAVVLLEDSPDAVDLLLRNVVATVTAQGDGGE